MAKTAVNPSAMTTQEAAALLRVETATVQEHLAAGLPTDERGRIHLVEYVAWLLVKLGEKQ